MRNLIILLILGVFPVCVIVQYHLLNVKTGQWQTTVLVNSGGSLVLSFGQMAKLTPEQRV